MHLLYRDRSYKNSEERTGIDAATPLSSIPTAPSHFRWNNKHFHMPGIRGPGKIPAWLLIRQAQSRCYIITVVIPERRRPLNDLLADSIYICFPRTGSMTPRRSLAAYTASIHRSLFRNFPRIAAKQRQDGQYNVMESIDCASEIALNLK